MLQQEVLTELDAREVIERARDFFTLRFSPYAGGGAGFAFTNKAFRTDWDPTTSVAGGTTVCTGLPGGSDDGDGAAGSRLAP